MDVWGPSPIVSDDGFHFYRLIADDYTRFSWLFLLQQKSQVFDTFDSVIAKLQIPFAMKNLGQLHYFLGIEAHFHQGSLFMSPSKEIVHLFKRDSMFDAKPIDTPIAPKVPLSSLHGEPLDDAT